MYVVSGLLPFTQYTIAVSAFVDDSREGQRSSGFIIVTSEACKSSFCGQIPAHKQLHVCMPLGGADFILAALYVAVQVVIGVQACTQPWAQGGSFSQIQVHKRNSKGGFYITCLRNLKILEKYTRLG
jgi:hypothetical protein